MQVTRFNTFLVGIYLICFSDIGATKSNSKEMDRQTWISSYSLLTPDYGILSQADLAISADHYYLMPFDPFAGRGGAFWQCFPTKHVSLVHDTWKDNDPMGRSDIILTMCSFEIRTRNGDIWNDYLERRAHQHSYCLELSDNWKRLIHKEPFVCLHGEAAGIERKTIKGRSRTVRQWVWMSFKTRKGCHSYFVDDCVAAK